MKSAYFIFANSNLLLFRTTLKFPELLQSYITDIFNIVRSSRSSETVRKPFPSHKLPLPFTDSLQLHVVIASHLQMQEHSCLSSVIVDCRRNVGYSKLDVRACLCSLSPDACLLAEGQAARVTIEGCLKVRCDARAELCTVWGFKREVSRVDGCDDHCDETLEFCGGMGSRKSW